MSENEKKMPQEHAQKEHAPHQPAPHHAAPPKDDGPSSMVLLVIAFAAVLILFNQWQIFSMNSMIGAPRVAAAGSVQTTTLATAPTLASASDAGDEYTVLAPALLAAGEAPVLQGYRTKVKAFPTISARPKPAPTGDAVQDAINWLVPTGTPPYGEAASVSFDDPLNAQRTWGAYERSIQLDATQQERWSRIVGTFTCDYCCGSPSNPTIITRCGCAHARAWRGMAKWFTANYGDTYSDAQIQGEMARWKALWYPGPTVQRVIQEGAMSGTAAATVDPSALPSMVGGC